MKVFEREKIDSQSIILASQVTVGDVVRFSETSHNEASKDSNKLYQMVDAGPFKDKLEGKVCLVSLSGKIRLCDPDRPVIKYNAQVEISQA